MRFSTQLILIMFVAVSLVSCYNFGMTRTVKKSIIQPEINYRIINLISLKQSAKNTLIVEADIEKDLKLINNVCGVIRVPPGKVELGDYPWPTGIIFSECDPLIKSRMAVFKEINQNIWNKNRYEYAHINIEIPTLVDKEIKFKYYRLQDITVDDINSHISISSIYFSNRKNVNMVWYPFAFSYDLIAGTIHSVGAPFGMVCLYGTANNENKFLFFASLPFCKLSKVFSFLDEVGK
ncbi:hypothetical protein V6Z05_14895 [Leptospira venezuelensis]|uniref:hypothetical protein n=1 Tax=Leptospira venezuelensis TaxID=1958811 RepID=UPI000A3B90F6|nr:hypothetical protein [Leptospira venezuelensis]